jgi:predicted phosphoribosyltransferase
MLNYLDMIFHNRSQAVEKLAQELMRLKLRDPFVLAIPGEASQSGASSRKRWVVACM